jgi:hypothetical protein
VPGNWVGPEPPDPMPGERMGPNPGPTQRPRGNPDPATRLLC